MQLRFHHHLLRYLAILLVAGCGRSSTPTAAVQSVPSPSASSVKAPETVEYPLAIAERTPQQKYESDLADAIARFREDKLPEAYSALKKAQAANNTPVIQAAIAAIELRAESAQVANSVLEAVNKLIADGRSDLARPLIRDAVRIYGAGPVGPRLAWIHRQVEALETASMEPAARAARFQKDLEESIAGNFMRNGVLAFEQSVFVMNDARLRRAFEDVRTRLRRYESAMARAASTRQDPLRRADFRLATREAAEMWPTLEVARMVDEHELMEECARDRVVLLDFDVQGGPSAIGSARAIARDLTGALRGRYDVVDRPEWMQVLTSLGLSAEQLANDDDARREFAQRANVRYLVTGEVFAGNGMIVRGRIQEAFSGAVVQTSRIVGVAPDAIERFIPQFVAMLFMTDEQRWAYESQLAPIGTPETAATEGHGLPKMPELIEPTAPTRVFAASVRHPEMTGDVLAALRTPSNSLSTRPTATHDHPMRERACALAVERGDDLLRRGRFLAAHEQYTRALGLSCNPLELMPRIDRCRAHVSTGDAAAAPSKLIVCDFAVGPGLDSPGAGPCLGDLVSAYAARSFSVIDRAELNWCMDRLGVRYRDVVADPNVRFYLARALDARFLAMGSAARVGSDFEAGVTVFDAAAGSPVADVRVRAESWPALRGRLDELVEPSNWLPASGAKSSSTELQIDSLLGEARKHGYFKNFETALELAREAAQLRRNAVRTQAAVDHWSRQIQQVKIADNRETTARHRQLLIHAERAPRIELLRRVESARATPSQPVAEFDRLRQRDRAQSQLIAQARSARSDGDYELATHWMTAAIGLQSRPELEQEYAQVHRQFLSQRRAREYQDAEARNQARQRQLDAEIGAIKTRLTAARAERAARQQLWAAFLAETDRREQARLVAEARSTSADDPRHLWLLQCARRLSAIGDTERLIGAARLAQARAIAQQQGALAELETRLTAELANRPKLESDARRNQNFYAESIKSGEQALRFGQFERASKLYSEALRFVQTDDALRGLRAAQDEHQRAKDVADARAASERNANVDINKLLETGRAAFEQGRFDEALSAFRRARSAAPNNNDVATWVARAEKAQVDQLATERRRPGDIGAAIPNPSGPPPSTTSVASKANQEQKPKLGNVASPAIPPESKAESLPETKPPTPLDPAARLRADFDRLVEQGQIALSFRRFDEAELTLDSALRLIPGDAAAVQLLAQAKNKVGPPPDFVRHMQTAATHEKQDRYGDAHQAYREALKIAPNDPIASRRADYTQRMDLGFKALRSNNAHQAVMEFESALKAAPNDPAAARALRQAKSK